MQFLDTIGSTVNRAARRERHERLKLISPLLKTWARVEGTLSPREKKLEKNFFWRVTALGAAAFLILTIFPQFVTTAEDFWTPPQPEEFSSEAAEDLGLIAEGGFLLKPELVNSEGTRVGLTDIREYQVEPGDTLSGIAKKHGVTVNTILQNNDIANANALKAGKIIKIIPVNGLLHTVAKGESLQKIAEKYKIDQKNIIAQNKLKEGAGLQEGAALIIPGAQKAAPPAPRQIAGLLKGIPAGAGRAAVGKLLKPASGYYTQYFHYGHWAVDIAGKSGSAIHAAADGVVEEASYGYSGGYGNHIIVDHGNGLKTLYAHNKELYVKAGDSVAQGETIAAMGNTGRVYGKTGVHSHFEVRVKGVKQNPLSYF